jgi:hypothetical protein
MLRYISQIFTGEDEPTVGVYLSIVQIAVVAIGGAVVILIAALVI